MHQWEAIVRKKGCLWRIALLNKRHGWGGADVKSINDKIMKWNILRVLHSEATELLKKAEEFQQRITEFADKRHPTSSEKASIAAKCFELRLIWNTWNRPEESNLPHIHRQQIFGQIRRVQTDLQLIWEIERHLGSNASLKPEHIERLEEYVEDLIWDLENGWVLKVINWGIISRTK